MSGYIAAKSAVVGLMRSVADEGRSRGLRANAVAPISIRTGDNLRQMGSATRYVEREAVPTRSSTSVHAPRDPLPAKSFGSPTDRHPPAAPRSRSPRFVQLDRSLELLRSSG